MNNGFQWRQWVCLLSLVALSACGGEDPIAESAAQPARPTWRHLSSADGDLPAPGPSDQQTGSHVADFDNDGVSDFVVSARMVGPCLTWFRRTADGWDKYIIDSDYLRIEAGGASFDIDGDGDLDLVFGADSQDNHIWWWENPHPNHAPDKNWTRRVIKNSGANKHHDQIFGDFDGDGRVELVSWNQRGKALLLFEIPENPRESGAWPSSNIYTWESGDEHEGVAAADLNQDGKLDLVGGGRWFEHKQGTTFEAHLIDDGFRFSRAAAGDLVKGGRPEVVFQPGDVDGRIAWFEWKDGAWQKHELLGYDVIHGHTLAVSDIDADGNLDIFSAEMGQWGGQPTVNPNPKMRIFWGDGQGNFTEQVVAEGFGNHESRLADLDGDGDIDILGKPYNWKAPRVDIWLQEPPQANARNSPPST